MTQMGEGGTRCSQSHPLSSERAQPMWQTTEHVASPRPLTRKPFPLSAPAVDNGWPENLSDHRPLGLFCASGQITSGKVTWGSHHKQVNFDSALWYLGKLCRSADKIETRGQITDRTWAMGIFMKTDHTDHCSVFSSTPTLNHNQTLTRSMVNLKSLS